MTTESFMDWREEYESGIKPIDDQHKHIVSFMNTLYYAVENVSTEQEISVLIRELDTYVTAHFRLEEFYGEKYDYPGLKKLKESHDFFRLIYQELRTDYQYTFNISHILAVMNEWLVFHLNTQDKALLEYLREKNITE